MIKTKSVYEAAGPDDGFRLVVMRRWPRGIAKGQVDGGDKELGPSLALLEEWRRGGLAWEEFVRRYREEMASKAPAIGKLAQRAQKEDITLLCGCRDETRCHRTLLKQLVEQADLAR